MPTKFISFLGFGTYSACSYFFENEQEEPYVTRFVQVSLIRHLVLSGQLSPDDEILFLVTDAAKSKNYLNNQDEIGNIIIGLEGELARLEKTVLKPGKFRLPKIKTIGIPEGKSENELWQIFNTLVDNVNDSDRVFYDITHSFRSLPTLALVVLNYLRIVKKITIEKIFYGAYEAKSKAVDIEHAPIFDLTPFVDLMEWTTAADHFIRTGNTLLLSELTKKEIQPILSLSRGKNEKANILNKLSKSLEKFGKDLFIVNGPKISKDIYQLNDNIQNSKESVSEIPPLAYLFEKIQKPFETAQVPESIVENTNIVIRFCFNHGLIQQGFTLLDENLITYGCLKNGLDHIQPKFRELYSSVFGLKEKPESQWQLRDRVNQKTKKVSFSKEEQLEAVKKIMSSDSELDILAKLRKQISQLRNALNHATFNASGVEYDVYIEKGNSLLTEFEKMISAKKDNSKVGVYEQ
ncbi:MAG: TIGR02221 family CRISPR-associated protein [Calditrichaceae bacterium]|nr:TIGR02221 family CRISPR-associated protein [Calditrichia bacterium]NUQ43917.1 TIGR02221 family CRISPR-associated protein [Calditrichaceae bacterium]